MANWITRLAGKLATHVEDADTGWQRIARLSVRGAGGVSRLEVDPNKGFRLIKLRSLSAGVEVYRWILKFDDGTTQDLSVNCLLDGADSSAMLIAGSRLTGMVVEYEATKATRQGRLEIWAQP